MMQLTEPRIGQANVNQVSQELRIRIWWALFAADNWCSSSLGFPCQMKDWPRPVRLPMDERLFAEMNPDETLEDLREPYERPGLWAHMATLIEVFSPIQELNWRAANNEGLHPDQIEQDTTWLARGRQQPGCEAVYPTVGHMAIVSSSVLLHNLLFGEENELPPSRHCLEANFEALLELEEYWPVVKTMK
ncbi:hypothetical protein PoHVEF18_010052 [Penicillium ochrochloron]